MFYLSSSCSSLVQTFNLHFEGILQKGFTYVFLSSYVSQERWDTVHILQYIVFIKLPHIQRKTRMCYILEKVETTMQNGDRELHTSFQSFSHISHYPHPDTIQFTSLNCEIIFCTILLLKNSQRC